MPVNRIRRILKRPYAVVDDLGFNQRLISLDVDDHIILSWQLGHRLMTPHCACINHSTPLGSRLLTCSTKVFSMNASAALFQQKVTDRWGTRCWS